MESRAQEMKTTRLDGHPNYRGIRSYVDMRLAHIANAQRNQSSIRSALVKILKMDDEWERISQKVTSKTVGKLLGGFLLAELQINTLKVYKDEELRGQLDDLAESLKDIFERSMERIEKLDPAACVTGKRALLWAIYAKRPLTLLELSEALATYRYLDLGYVPAVIQRRDRLSAIQ